MTKTTFQTQYGRIFETIFGRASDYVCSQQLDLALGTVYDGIALLNKTVNARNKSQAAPLFMASGLAIAKIARGFQWARNRHQRFALTNVAINYLMLAREIFESQNQSSAAAEALTLAYQFAPVMSFEENKFPDVHLILSCFTADNYGIPKHLCDVEQARQLLVARHIEAQECLRKIDMQISLARHILHSAAGLIDSCAFLFAIRMGDKILKLRPDIETPYGIKGARRHVAAGYAYIAQINQAEGDLANVNRACRAVIVARMMEALVKSSLAGVYVEYWRKAPKYSNFSVLGHQALANAQACSGDNWTFYAPPALVHAHEPLLEDTEREIRMLCNYANAALAYALCLDAEMKVGWRRDRLVLPEPVEVPAPTEDEPIEPGPLPAVNAWILAPERNLTQAQIRSTYHSVTGDDLRENHHYGIGTYERVNPKQRLAGFSAHRGGKKHRQKKSRLD